MQEAGSLRGLVAAVREEAPEGGLGGGGFGGEVVEAVMEGL